MKSMKRFGTEMNEEIEIGISQRSIEDEYEEKLLSLETECAAIREQFKEKTRILELQLKESQGNVQNLERNLDILERSHELLKYDYEHYGGEGESHTQHLPRQRMMDKPTEGRQGHKQHHYEDKIIQLFTYMDSLRNEYIELMSRIEKEDAVEQNLNGEQSEDRKTRIAKVLRVRDEEGFRKDLTDCRRELNKLKEDFSEFVRQVNTGHGEMKTILIKPN